MGLLISSLPQKSQLFSLWTQEMTANESPDITNYTAKCPTFKSITSLVVWPWANYLLSWYPSTLICKTGYNDSKFLELWWGFNELVYLQMLRTMPATHSSHSMNIYYYHDNMNHYHIFLNYLDQIARSYFFFIFSFTPHTESISKSFLALFQNISQIQWHMHYYHVPILGSATNTSCLTVTMVSQAIVLLPLFVCPQLTIHL